MRNGIKGKKIALSLFAVSICPEETSTYFLYHTQRGWADSCALSVVLP